MELLHNVAIPVHNLATRTATDAVMALNGPLKAAWCVKAKQGSKDASKDDENELLEQAIAQRKLQELQKNPSPTAGVSSSEPPAAAAKSGEQQQPGQSKPERRTIKAIRAEKERAEQARQELELRNPWRLFKHRMPRDRCPLDASDWLLHHEPCLSADVPDFVMAALAFQMQQHRPTGPIGFVKGELLRLLDPCDDPELAVERGDEYLFRAPGYRPRASIRDLVMAAFEIDPDSTPRSEFIGFQHRGFSAQDAAQASRLLRRAIVIREAHPEFVQDQKLIMHRQMFCNPGDNARCPAWASTPMQEKVREALKELRRPAQNSTEALQAALANAQLLIKMLRHAVNPVSALTDLARMATMMPQLHPMLIADTACELLQRTVMMNHFLCFLAQACKVHARAADTCLTSSSRVS